MGHQPETIWACNPDTYAQLCQPRRHLLRRQRTIIQASCLSQAQENHIRVWTARVKDQPRDSGKPVGQAASSGMVFSQSAWHGFQSDDPGSRQDPGLTHASAELLAHPVSAPDELL